MNILGISAYYHDSAACVVQDGNIVAAAQEERFSRKKHDHRFPTSAVEFCLREAGISSKQIDLIAFYDKPLLKFERLLETYLDYAPSGIRSFLMAMPLWLREKLWMREQILRSCDSGAKVVFTEHHESHAASAFFPSPFDSAAVLTIDGVGEWATSSYGRGIGNSLELYAETRFPHSLGLLYSAFTYYTGFKVNSGEYKVMGLAPYGEPKFVAKILDQLVHLADDGSIQLNMEYFGYAHGLTMTTGAFDRLFGAPPRKPESPLTQRDMDLARSIQEVCELGMLKMARHVHRETGERNLCMAGGVALNCVGNGRILREGPFEQIWIQPAAGDAGGALGAALSAWYQYLGNPRDATAARGTQSDAMKGSYLGPRFQGEEIEGYLRSVGASFKRLSASCLVQGGGPPTRRRESHRLVQRPDGIRAARARRPKHSGRSAIAADAVDDESQDQVPGELPAVRAVGVARTGFGEYFKMDCDSPYMLMVAPVRDEIRVEMTTAAKRAIRDREAECAAVLDSRDHPRRLFGASADGEARRQPDVLRPDRGIRPAHRLPDHRQHVVQRSRRANCLHAEGRLSMLHAHRNRYAGSGGLSAGQGRPTGTGG